MAGGLKIFRSGISAWREMSTAASTAATVKREKDGTVLFRRLASVGLQNSNDAKVADVLDEYEREGHWLQRPQALSFASQLRRFNKPHLALQVTKKIEDMTYQLTDAHSIYRQSPLSRVSGFATVAVTLLSSRSFSSRPSYPINESQGPSPINYRSVLQEDEFHKLADSTIHDMLEKLEEYGDGIDIDGFDIDYGNEVLTLKLGNLGTYVLNKQTPNRQIWLSSPISGPSRFDWDPKSQAWIYRRNQANLFKILESEIEKLCGQPLNLC